MKEFFSWEILSTVTGASAATGLITQGVKPFVTIIPTQILAYLIAMVLLIAGDVYKRNYSNITLSIFNAFVVASVASNTVALVGRLT